MARSQPKDTCLFFFLICFSHMIIVNNSEPPQPFSEIVKSSKRAQRGQVQTHLHFYFHDLSSGLKPTIVRIAPPSTNTTTTFEANKFGDLVMMDDPLTQGPSLKSKLVERAQGIYGVASESELSLALLINYEFMEEDFNGSTLCIVGRNSVFDKVREFPILGGTGVFRFARGYAQANTHTFNVTSGGAVVEYNVSVFH